MSYISISYKRNKATNFSLKINENSYLVKLLFSRIQVLTGWILEKILIV